MAQAPHPLVERALLEMFRRVLDEAGDNDPPHPTGEARLAYAVWDDAYRLTVPFRMPDGRVEDQQAFISASALMQYQGDIPRSDVRYVVASMWSRCYEDHYMHRMERAARNAMAVAPDARTYEVRQRAWEQLREHTINVHNSPFIVRDEDLSRETATQVRHRQEMVDRHVRNITRRVDDHLMQTLFGSVSSNVEPAPSGERTTYEIALEALQRLGDFRANNHWANHWRDAFVYGGGRGGGRGDAYGSEIYNPEVGTKEAQVRGLQLLKENLTPEQLASYEKNKHFDVKGGETGKTYRIRHGRQMNITELDAKGNRVCGWCFLPQGALVSGDCMLAQKTALELFETEALGIANRFS